MSAVTDPIADMLTRIRNASMVGHSRVAIPSSKFKVAIARVLKEEGYIEDFQITSDRPQPKLIIKLKYVGERRFRKPAISGLRRVSKPGRRVYVGKEEIPLVMSGMGIAILSTPKGVMTDKQARRLGVGGEILCYIW
ncbi:MAG: 30S ribosomal protein S8 [Thermoflexus sp.]|jgi:small subunit ribosomal protein S8|nr:30S ribosomal protein S8 [Thermoflexus sp.]